MTPAGFRRLPFWERQEMQIAVLMESYLEQRSMDRIQEAADRDAAFKQTAAKAARKIKGVK